MSRVIARKIRTLLSNPVGVYRKYVRIFDSKLRKEIPPLSNEDYDEHWGFTDFKGKTVLDIGADYGSTAYYFLLKGARKVVAVEGNPKFAKKLSYNFRNNHSVVSIVGFVKTGRQLDALIAFARPDLVKVDIEGDEVCLLEARLLKKPKEWLVEAHTDEIYKALLETFEASGFHTTSRHYVNGLKIIHARRS
jgi:precorrin-6B methylase 2